VIHIRSLSPMVGFLLPLNPHTYMYNSFLLQYATIVYFNNEQFPLQSLEEKAARTPFNSVSLTHRVLAFYVVENGNSAGQRDFVGAGGDVSEPRGVRCVS